jgi:hypothetical protein
MNGADTIVFAIVSAAKTAVFGKDVVQSFSELFRMYHDAPHGIAALVNQIRTSRDQITTTVDPKLHTNSDFVSHIVNRYELQSQILIADLQKIPPVRKGGKIDKLLRCRAAIIWWIRDKQFQKGFERLDRTRSELVTHLIINNLHEYPGMEASIEDLRQNFASQGQLLTGLLQAEVSIG